jgi:hypothetical protein
VNEVKEITVLAVTKMHGGVCSAGIDSSGNWVRPIRKPASSHWERSGITDYCLLPIDFFHGGRSHLTNLGITRIHLTEPRPRPPHIEDWLLDTCKKPELIRKLSQDEQAAFLAANTEGDLSALEPLRSRSLALVRSNEFSFRFRQNVSADDVAVRASFRIGNRLFADIGCTDLRMRALGRMLFAGPDAAPVELSHLDFKRRGKTATYLAVGLSRLYQDKHWLIVVGVHSIPEMEIDVDYARL